MEPDRLKAHFVAQGGAIGEMRAFGTTALSIGGRIFALLDHGALVVKLPAGRVEALESEGIGRRFDGHRGRPMKEWLSLPEAASARWIGLAEEALRFVEGRAGGGPENA